MAVSTSTVALAQEDLAQNLDQSGEILLHGEPSKELEDHSKEPTANRDYWGVPFGVLVAIINGMILFRPWDGGSKGRSGGTNGGGDDDRGGDRPPKPGPTGPQHGRELPRQFSGTKPITLVSFG